MAGLGWLRRLFPVSCVFCYQDADRYGICDACRDDLPQPGVVCVGCAEPLPVATASNLYCAGCQQHPPPWSACRAVLPYSWPVDVALQRLKFGRDLAFAVAFGEMLAALVAAEMHAVDALCPVPLHRLRQLRRGFNQADELCKPLRRASGLPVVRSVRRLRHTAAQSGLGQKARRQNMRDAFGMAGPLRCSHPLIIDDIMTTGETCRQLAGLLLEHGATAVSVLVVARAAAPSQAVTGLNV